MEGKSPVYQVNPVSRITGEGKAEVLSTWGPRFDQEGAVGKGGGVSLDRHSTTVTNVVEGCVYIRRRFYAISVMRGELQHSALCSFSPLCPVIQRR